MNNIELYFGNLPEKFDSVLILLSLGKSLVYVKNKKRAWELTGGKKEKNESIEETAVREAYEEAGAIINKNSINNLGYYRLPDGHITIISQAEVSEFHEIPSHSETIERKVTCSPISKENLSFKDNLYERIFQAIGWNMIK